MEGSLLIRCFLGANPETRLFGVILPYIALIEQVAAPNLGGFCYRFLNLNKAKGGGMKPRPRGLRYLVS